MGNRKTGIQERSGEHRSMEITTDTDKETLPRKGRIRIERQGAK